MNNEPYFPEQQAIDIGNAAASELSVKYARGQQEHGGNFFAKPTASNIREEVLDLIAYSHVLLNHRDEITNKLEKLKSDIIDRRINSTSSVIAELDAIIKLAKEM